MSHSIYAILMNISCKLVSSFITNFRSDPLKESNETDTFIQEEDIQKTWKCNLISLSDQVIEEGHSYLTKQDEDKIPELVIGYEEREEREEERNVQNKNTHNEKLEEYLVTLLDAEYSALYPNEETINWESDILIFPRWRIKSRKEVDNIPLYAFTAYKRVGQKIHPVSGTFPEQVRVQRIIPNDPLKSLPILSPHPPDFEPTKRLTHERMEGLKINQDNFLWAEEEKLFQQIVRCNDLTLAFEEKDRGTLKREYFSDYIMATIPHSPWEYRNIPIPPGIREKVIEMLKSKIEAGVYEPSQSSYRGRWLCVNEEWFITDCT